jgi:hypothetical protein
VGCLQKNEGTTCRVLAFWHVADNGHCCALSWGCGGGVGEGQNGQNGRGRSTRQARGWVPGVWLPTLVTLRKWYHDVLLVQNIDRPMGGMKDMGLTKYRGTRGRAGCGRRVVRSERFISEVTWYHLRIWSRYVYWQVATFE